LDNLLKIIEGINWTGVIAVINLGAIFSVIRIITALQKKQIQHLEDLKQSEFAKEIQAFRIFYEEKKLMLDDEKARVEEETKEQVSNVKLKMQEAEEELKTIINELELTKTENEKLNNAMNRSIASNQQFTSDILSHEIRQGINAIISNCEYLLVKHNQNTDVSRRVEDVKNEALSMSYLIKRTRVPFYGTLPTQLKENISIKKYISNVLPVINMAARQKNNKVNISFSNKNDQIVVFNPELLELVLFETISNAIKFSKAGSEVNIDTKESDDYFTINISNVSLKQSEDELSKIFDKGYRGKTASNYSVSGSGLGLWVTKHAIDKFGGLINITSSDDIFTVSINLPRS